MSPTVRPTHRESGFTLIELSIVLVIIGLIAGGILVGQDMIKAAEIRSTVRQVEQLNSAMNTFRDKYKFLPGDISKTYATNFGFVTRAGSVGQGDGNGLLQMGATTATQMNIGNENALVWVDLGQVGLLGGSFTAATDATVTAASPDVVKTYLPEAKMGRGNYITVYADAGLNYYQLGGITSIASGVATLGATMSPQEAFNLDTKMDDGQPLTGSSRAMTATGTALDTIATAATAAAGTCVATGTPASYDTGSDTFANTPACALRVRFN